MPSTAEAIALAARSFTGQLLRATVTTPSPDRQAPSTIKSASISARRSSAPAADRHLAGDGSRGVVGRQCDWPKQYRVSLDGLGGSAV
jgi:hypothetical protein